MKGAAILLAITAILMISGLQIIVILNDEMSGFNLTETANTTFHRLSELVYGIYGATGWLLVALAIFGFIGIILVLKP